MVLSLELGVWSVELRTKVNLWCAAVAASAPSEEGAVKPFRIKRA